MKNDLTPFEKDLLKQINLLNNTKYNYKNLMEWSSDKKHIQKNIKDSEILYEALGMFVAIKPQIKELCEGCNVREGHEHRCTGECNCKKKVCKSIQK